MVDSVITWPDMPGLAVIHVKIEITTSLKAGSSWEDDVPLGDLSLIKHINSYQTIMLGAECGS